MAPIRSNRILSLDMVTLFSRVPIDEALTVVRNRLESASSLGEYINITIDNHMEMLTFYVQTTLYQLESDIYQQDESSAMSSPL